MRRLLEMALPVLLPLLFNGHLQSHAAAAALTNNPFSRPLAFAKPRPDVHRSQKENKPNLQLTATLVSKDLPMVIVNGRLLGMGEEFHGYILNSVSEGGAVFIRNGERLSVSLVGSGEEIE